MITLDHVSFWYGENPILQDITFSLKEGEVVSLIGASGSGKTTLFKLLTGLINPQKGTITVAGMQMPDGKDQISYMMQEDLLLPWRTVIKNMTLTKELGTRPLAWKEIALDAQLLLDEIGMSGCKDKFPDQLSGGMRQRVSLARSLLQKRPILLLDEPFGALDVALREQLYLLLRQIQAKYNTTILLVTHDFRDAMSLSDRIILLAEGKIQREWNVPDDIMHDPAQMVALYDDLRNSM